MSRLAKKPVAIPSGVTVEEKGGAVTVKGPKGVRVVPCIDFVKLAVEGGNFKVEGTGSHKQAKANLGTMWSLIRNAIEGVTEGFQKVLEIEGVGYRAAIEGSTLVLSLGYVNPVRVPVPEDITITVEKNVIRISGIDKDLVGRTASQIRSLKKPEPYKGKGIRYQGEVIIRKVGKKAATGAAA